MRNLCIFNSDGVFDNDKSLCSSILRRSSAGIVQVFACTGV